MFLYFFIITLLLLLAYAVVIISYRRWFLQLKPFVASPNEEALTKFSVIIPARNEAEQISKCLLSVLHQNYPQHLFEVIVVDDYSTDETAAIVENLQQQYANLHLIQLSKMLYEKQLNSYKKKAIELAIQQASGDYVVTTDADCIVNIQWLQTFDNYLQKTNAVFVAAPVKFMDNGSFVSRFQCLDFLSLQGITAAAVAAGFHSMCNGANLCYSRPIFKEVGGFKGIDNIASGDDMMLMHKIYKAHPRGLAYLFAQQAIVHTQPMHDWSSFFNQRIRWASKADKFQDKRIIAVLALVYLLNVSFFATAIAAFWCNQLWYLLAGMFVLKAATELSFLWPVSSFFGEKKLLKWFVIMQPFHIVYTVIAGWLGKFGKYQWKGRNVK